MAHTVIGTAGHIDHGKTLLVKALTGMDTDQAPEERARGITIELGFAFLGDQATIIDVPGHERFVKTMVAGVSTIDVAMLVIAADDGVMPQSREHLDVLRLLGVERGVVVINKADLVEEEWLGLVVEEVREFVRGSFLAQAEIFRVSALSGAGIDPLRQRLLAMVEDTAAKRTDAPFRLPVDRAFGVKGFGLVCTGTVQAGALAEGDRVEIAPEGRSARVRRLQQHGATVQEVRAGDRAAINLAGVEQDQIERGHSLVAPGFFPPHADAGRRGAAPRFKPYDHSVAHPRAPALGDAGDYGAGRAPRWQALDAWAGEFCAASPGGSRNCGVGRPLCAAPVLAGADHWWRPRAQPAPG